MPLVRIDLVRGKSAHYRKALGEIVYKAMVDVINVPTDDKFQVITEHAPEELTFPESYLGNHYSQDAIFIQITLNSGRSLELKTCAYRAGRAGPVCECGHIRDRHGLGGRRRHVDRDLFARQNKGWSGSARRRDFSGLDNRGQVHGGGGHTIEPDFSQAEKCR
jgi:hypothetical protein